MEPAFHWLPRPRENAHHNRHFPTDPHPDREEPQGYIKGPKGKETLFHQLADKVMPLTFTSTVTTMDSVN